MYPYSVAIEGARFGTSTVKRSASTTAFWSENVGPGPDVTSVRYRRMSRTTLRLESDEEGVEGGEGGDGKVKLRVSRCDRYMIVPGRTTLS